MESNAKPKEDEADIVAAMRELTIRGEIVPVREFSFIQELEVLRVAQPIIDDLATLFAGDEDATATEIELVFADHREAFISLLSISTGKPIDWFNDLTSSEGTSLYLTFWVVNSHFFTQRVAGSYLMKSRSLLDNQSSSEESSPP